MATRTIDGVTADFQEGGWYSGRQYWNGTLSAPGVINSQSNQQGAGQAVSTEVVKQTNPANVSYIQSQQGGQTSTPTTKESVTPYLNDYQDKLFSASSSPEVRVPTMAELKTELEPTTPLPDVLNRTEEFTKLRTEYGLADLETTLTNLKAQEESEIANLRSQRGLEEGKVVPLNVIAGRISEEERVAQERVDAIVRQKATVIDELNTKYNVVNQLMTFKGLDYNDAVARYESEYDRNLKMYDIILGQEKEARTAFQVAQTAARANLQIYVNAAINGNIDYNSLGADQKLMINKLEVQSGLPVGLISSIKKDPKADILFTTSNEGVTQIGMRNADGTVSVESYGTRTSGGGSNTSTTANKTAIQSMAKSLSEAGGDDGIVNPDEWNQARQIWINAGYKAEDFDKAFYSQHAQPAVDQWEIKGYNVIF